MGKSILGRVIHVAAVRPLQGRTAQHRPITGFGFFWSEFSGLVPVYYVLQILTPSCVVSPNRIRFHRFDQPPPPRLVAQEERPLEKYDTEVSSISAMAFVKTAVPGPKYENLISSKIR